MRALFEHAAELGVAVHMAHIDDDPHLLGYYAPESRIVVVRLAMTRLQTDWVLAHELGHARYGHHCLGTYADTAAERQADAYAAALLIDPVHYARLERQDPDPHRLAEELDVHVDAVFAFERHHLTQMRGVTYARPRFGIGQWLHRAAVL